jgi:hypothetical protein
MNTPHLKIAEPCHENWQDMTTQVRKDSFGEQGRHCDKCCKVVVDFTSMPTEKVIAFISERKAEKICGRFRSEQVRTPEIINRPAKRYRIFFAALYFVFGGILFTSCKHEQEKMGKVAVENSFAKGAGQFQNVDSPLTLTKVKVEPVKPIGTICNKVDTTEPEIIKMGEVEYIPNDTIQK